MGIVIEYANASGEAAVATDGEVCNAEWDYLKFGADAPPREPDRDLNCCRRRFSGDAAALITGPINGKSWPDTESLMVQRGKRYRLGFNNDSGRHAPDAPAPAQFRIGQVRWQADLRHHQGCGDVPARQDW